jgi:hypothetical protein
VALDEGSSAGSRTTFQDKKNEDQGLIAPETSTSGGVVRGTELGYGGCFFPLRLGPYSHGSPFLSPSDVGADDTGGAESKPEEASKGMCRYRRGDGFL